MKHKNLPALMTGLILVILLLAGCNRTLVKPTVTPMPPTAIPPTDTPVPPTNTPLPPTNTPVPPTDTPLPATVTLIPPTNTPLLSPTPTTIPTAISGSFDPITAGPYQFQIDEVRRAKEIVLTARYSLIIKGMVETTATGVVPEGAKSGNKLLIVTVMVLAGESRDFAETNLIDASGEQGPIVVFLTFNQGERVILVYDVSPSSKAFSLVFPEGVIVDITSLVQ